MQDFLQAPRSGAASDTFADYAAFVFNVVSVSLAPLKAPRSSAASESFAENAEFASNAALAENAANAD